MTSLPSTTDTTDNTTEQEDKDRLALHLLMELVTIGRQTPDPKTWRPLLPAFKKAFKESSPGFRDTVHQSLSSHRKT